MDTEYDELTAETTWPKSLAEHEAEFNTASKESDHEQQRAKE